MSHFFVSTDSTADLFVDEITSLGVGFLPLTLTVDKGEIIFMKDSFTDAQQYVDFFNMLRDAVPVKTSMNNFDIHYNYFLSLAQKGIKDVIHFTISYGLAPTMDVANSAIAEVKKTYPDFNVRVIESHTTTVGQGILVRVACRLRDADQTLDSACEYLEEYKHHIQHFVIVDDLQHLKRGGRISGAAAAIGTIAQLKIVITFDENGKLQVIKKVMGGMKKAIKTIAEEYGKYTPPEQDNYVVVVHTDNKTGAEELSNELVSRYPSIKPEIRIMGPTIGCHVGPNAVAYVFVTKERRPSLSK